MLVLVLVPVLVLVLLLRSSNAPITAADGDGDGHRRLMTERTGLGCIDCAGLLVAGWWLFGGWRDKQQAAGKKAKGGCKRFCVFVRVGVDVDVDVDVDMEAERGRCSNNHDE